jgi:hypothetical protein
VERANRYDRGELDLLPHLERRWRSELAHARCGLSCERTQNALLGGCTRWLHWRHDPHRSALRALWQLIPCAGGMASATLAP